MTLTQGNTGKIQKINNRVNHYFELWIETKQFYVGHAVVLCDKKKGIYF